MLKQRPDQNHNPLKAWVDELLAGPKRSSGDYFERLRVTIASSAPDCTSCHS